MESINPRVARWIAWSLAGAFFVLAGTGLFFQVQASTTPGDVTFPLILFIIVVIVVSIWPVIGALIIAHHSRHPVPWLLFATFPIVAIDMFTIGYASYATLIASDSLQLPGPMLIWLNWSGLPFAVVTVTVMLLLFPTGKVVSPRWRRVVWTSAGALPVLLIMEALEPGPLVLFPSLENPYAVTDTVWSVLAPVYFATIFVLVLSSLAAVISLFIRLRNAQGDERQQLKWLVIPAVIFWLGIPVGLVDEYDPSGIALGIGVALHLISVPAIVIAVAFAILKYRLYDIDLIINRSLVYGALTASVAGLYALIVGGAGLVIQTNLSLTSVLITAVVAAVIFRPLRGLLQRRVDRLAPVGRTNSGAPPSSRLEPRAPTFPKSEEAGQEPVRHRQATDSGDRLPVIVWSFLRTLWPVVAVITGGVAILAIPARIDVNAAGMPGDLAALLPSWLITAVDIALILAQAAVSLISLVMAGVLYVKRPKERTALLLSYFLLSTGIVMAPLTFLEPFWPGAQALTYTVIQPLFFAPLLIAVLSVFPSGRFVPSWTRWLVAGAILNAPVGVFVFTAPSYIEPTPVFVLAVLLWFALIFAGLYAQIARYRGFSNAIERQQAKWVIYGFSVGASLALLLTVLTLAFNHLTPGASVSWWEPLIQIGWYLAYAALPVTLTLAVMRYRLFEIDIIINRTLVYGGLTVSVAGIYALIVGGVSVLAQAEGNLIFALVATGLVAVLFQPLRERLQRAVNRLTYGERDEPFEALSRLGRRLEGIFSPEMVYPTIVETVAEGLKLPYVAIALKRGEQYEIAEANGSARGAPVAYPLMHQGEVVGRLLVGRRSPDEDFSAADQRLLRNFARQAGTAVHAAQLMADLQRSRQQLVTTREEERRRLRRDLHDGLGPALASVVWQADSARDLVYTDPPEAVHLLESTIEQAQAALADIRRLVYGLRPPALDELGLVGALEQAARQHPQTAVKVEAPAPLPQLPAAVEVAAYRIVQEALKNAAEHGRAGHCAVTLTAEGGLQLTVRDDGVGLPRGVTPGVGLVSMRERAEELGGAFTIRLRPAGGTEVEVCLPLALGE